MRSRRKRPGPEETLRCRYVDVFHCDDINGNLNARANVRDSEVRVIIVDDGIKAESFAYQFQNALHRNPGTGNAGFSEMNVRIDGYSFLHLFTADVEPPGNPDLMVVHHRVPEAVICLISALAFHGLTTQIPYRVYIALPAGSRNRPRITYPPIEVVWLGKAPYHAGVEQQMVDGFRVPIYDREKTIADCFKLRSKIGTDVAIEALKEYARLRDREIPKLIEYARIDRVDKAKRPYLEVLA